MKTKISATVDPDRLAEAKRLTGCDSVSDILNRALLALIDDELQRIHDEGYARLPQGDEVVKTVDPSVWSDLPWEAE